MKKFKSLFINRPIESQLMWLVMSVCIVTTLLLSIVLTMNSILQNRQALLSELTLASQLISKKAQSGLVFKQPDLTKKDLHLLSEKKSILLACIYTDTGALFTYYRANFVTIECPDTVEESTGHNFTWSRVELTKDIITNGGKVGTFYVKSDLSDLYRQTFSTILAIFLALLVSLVIGIFITSNLSKTITRELRIANKQKEKVQKKLEEALQKEQTFTTNMSHELRTPIHQIAGVTGIFSGYFNDLVSKIKELIKIHHNLQDAIIDIIGTKNQDEQLKQIVKKYNSKKITYGLNNEIEKLDNFLIKVHNKAKILARIIAKIFNIKRLMKNEMAFNIEKGNLLKPIEEILKDYTEDKHRIEFSIPKKPVLAMFDHNMVMIVLDNLFSNAVQYAPEGKLTITLEKKKFRDMANKTIAGIKFTLSDQGIGVPRDELDLIFQLYAESSFTKDQAGGRGIGLAESKRIIEAQNGRIWAQNNPGKGTSFIFVLPVN